MSDNVQWTSEVPRDDSLFIPIMSALTAGPQTFALLTGDLVGVWVHWLDNRTIPCVRSSVVECVCERRDCCRRWKGYLAGWEPRFCRKVLIEVTAEAIRLSNWGDFANINLRGRVVRLSRRGKNRSAPVVFEVTSAVLDETALPPSFDVRSALNHVWRGQARS